MTKNGLLHKCYNAPDATISCSGATDKGIRKGNGS